jgi:hypothetical protein
MVDSVILPLLALPPATALAGSGVAIAEVQPQCSVVAEHAPDFAEHLDESSDILVRRPFEPDLLIDADCTAQWAHPPKVFVSLFLDVRPSGSPGRRVLLLVTSHVLVRARGIAALPRRYTVVAEAVVGRRCYASRCTTRWKCLQHRQRVSDEVLIP